MPSTLHETLVDLFRTDLRLVAVLAAPYLDPLPDDLGRLAALDANLTDPRPLERRADLGVVPEHGPVFVLEVQLRTDPEKLWTWPTYVAVTRDRLRRDVMLVVLTLSAEVADWAGRPIPLGHRGSFLMPLVIGPAEVPVLTDPAEAIAHPEHLVLSALIHGRGPAANEIALAAAETVVRLDDARARPYTDLILNALGESARKLLEAALLQNYEYKSEFALKYIAQGEAQGEARGEARGIASSLLEVLRVRGLSPDTAARTRILATEDTAQLLRWLDRAVTATTVEEVLTA